MIPFLENNTSSIFIHSSLLSSVVITFLLFGEYFKRQIDGEHHEESHSNADIFSGLLTSDFSIKGCRKILEQSGDKYTDEQILKIKRMLYNLSLLDYEMFMKMKKQKA